MKSRREVGGREGEREGGREGGKEEGREGGREGKREGEREEGVHMKVLSSCFSPSLLLPMFLTCPEEQ